MRTKSDPERRAKPVSGENGACPHFLCVFETPSLIRHYVLYRRKGNANSAQ
jgi:hypothetical protein